MSTWSTADCSECGWSPGWLLRGALPAGLLCFIRISGNHAIEYLRLIGYHLDCEIWSKNIWFSKLSNKSLRCHLLHRFAEFDEFPISSAFEFSRLPSEEFLCIRSSDGEGDYGPVDAALADEGVFGTEREVSAHHLVADELAVSWTQTWNSRNQDKIQIIFPGTSTK